MIDLLGRKDFQATESRICFFKGSWDRDTIFSSSIGGICDRSQEGKLPTSTG